MIKFPKDVPCFVPLLVHSKTHPKSNAELRIACLVNFVQGTPILNMVSNIESLLYAACCLYGAQPIRLEPPLHSHRAPNPPPTGPIYRGRVGPIRASLSMAGGRRGEDTRDRFWVPTPLWESANPAALPSLFAHA